LTTSEGGILGQGVALVSSSVSLSHLHIIFHCKTLLYKNLNQNCNILYLEHLIYGLHVCTCVFLLRQESFNMILVNNPSFYDGGVTTLTIDLLTTAFIGVALPVKATFAFWRLISSTYQPHASRSPPGKLQYPAVGGGHKVSPSVQTPG
jgi:hypothetical protein